MKKKTLLLCSVLLISSLGMAQRGDTLRKYLDDKLVFTNKAHSVYPGVAIRKSDGWLLVSLYPDTGILVKAYFKDDEMKIKNGPLIFYHLNNIRAMQGYYVDNVQQGSWKFWYPNGQLKDSGIIKNNFFSGTWKSWYDDGTLAAISTYPDEDSITQVIHSSTYTSRKTSLFKGDTIVANKNGLWQAFYRNGSKRDSGSYVNNIKTGWWKTWYENGQPESSGYYTNNIQEGMWEYFRREGTPSTRETYKAGKVISMTCYDEQGQLTGSFCSILKPPVPLLERFVDLDNYLLDHIVWPDKILNNTSIEGVVKVQFTITKEGKLIDFKVLHSPHILLTREVERFFGTLPSWSPAVSHNRPIDFTMDYEVPFKR